MIDALKFTYWLVCWWVFISFCFALALEVLFRLRNWYWKRRLLKALVASR